jgi:hypothetical protein
MKSVKEVNSPTTVGLLINHFGIAWQAESTFNPIISDVKNWKILYPEVEFLISEIPIFDIQNSNS